MAVPVREGHRSVHALVELSSSLYNQAIIIKFSIRNAAVYSKYIRPLGKVDINPQSVGGRRSRLHSTSLCMGC